jgi:multiple antibiotic resistance protein
MLDSVLADIVTLWVVLDPIAAVSLFLSVTASETAAARGRIAARAVAIAAAILVAFAVLGGLLLHELGIAMPSFQIAGGLVLLAISMKMILGEESAAPRDDAAEAAPKGDVAVFPIAMPFIAGPGSIMAIVMLTDNDRYSFGEQAQTVAVMLGILFVVYLTLRAADKIERMVGPTGINVLGRIMGLILASLAVQAVLGGIATTFKLGPIA